MNTWDVYQEAQEARAPAVSRSFRMERKQSEPEENVLCNGY